MKNPRTWVLTVDRPIARFEATAQHLNDLGVKWERFNGFDNQVCRLNPVDTFDLDRAGERIAPKHIAATLSHMAIWYVMMYQPDEYFWILEYDVRLVEDWEAQYEEAMSVLPDDWDVLFIGSCCCAGRPTTHIGKNLYEVRYPLCGHAIQWRKKALWTLIREQQKICMPLDIALYHQAFTKLRVYTILEPIVVQEGTPLPP